MIFVFNPGLIFFTWLAFGLLLLLLGRYAWGPIVETLQEREEKIQSDLQKAEERKERAEFLVKEEESELKEAREKARQIVENKKRAGEKERKQIVNEAEQEARAKINAAEKRAREKEIKEFDRLKKELGVYAAMLGEQILEREISKEDHERLVESFIEDLETGELQFH